MTNVDWTKPIQTRDGRPMRYLMKLDQPTIHDKCTRLAQNTVTGIVWTYREDGLLCANQKTGHDIINVPEPAPSADELLVKARDLAKMMVRGGLGSWGSEQYSQALVDQIDAYLSAKDAKP